MADMIPVYLVACWIIGMLGGFVIGRYYRAKRILNELDVFEAKLKQDVKGAKTNAGGSE